MKKVIIVILILIFLSGLYFLIIKDSNKAYKSDRSINKVSSVSDLNDSDKVKIAEALIEGRDLFRSGNIKEIREYLIISKPDKNFDQLPDSAIQSLSAFLVNNKENFSKDDILNSTQWGINGNRIYVVVQTGSLTSRLEAVKVGNKWYRY